MFVPCKKLNCDTLFVEVVVLEWVLAFGGGGKGEGGKPGIRTDHSLSPSLRVAGSSYVSILQVRSKL